jgi:hypothetical protein
MPRKKVVRKERGVFEKVPGSDIWWIRYKVEGVEHREKVGRLETRLMSTGQQVGYLRVSSLDQNEVRQLERLALDKTFTDTTLGKDAKRPQSEAMRSFVRGGDTVFCHSMDRFARNQGNLAENRAWTNLAGRRYRLCEK